MAAKGLKLPLATGRNGCKARGHRLKRERDLDASAFGAIDTERAVDAFD
jgi:hypothetical protein